MNKLFQLKIESESRKVMILNGHSERSEELQGLKVDSSGKTLRMTNLFNHSPIQPLNSQKAFTLAEVLITLVIIGVVAAITVPMLMNDTNDKQWNVARQKAKATIGEALRLATVNGEISTSITSAKDFVSEVLAKKYLKISKTCDSATECGFSSEIKTPNGIPVTMPKKWSESTYAAITKDMPSTEGAWGTKQNFEEKYPAYDDSTFFQTLDGFSVNFFYNPYCVTTPKEKYRYYNPIYGENSYVQQSMDIACFNAVYDMNGSKGPNTVGKDIGFVTTFYNGYDTTAVAVLPHKDEKQVQDLPREGNDYWKAAIDYCNGLDEDNWILPDVYEVASIYLNQKLVQAVASTEQWHCVWSRTPLGNTDTASYFRAVHFFSTQHGGAIAIGGRTSVYWHDNARCVRRTTLK